MTIPDILKKLDHSYLEQIATILGLNLGQKTLLKPTSINIDFSKLREILTLESGFKKRLSSTIWQAKQLIHDIFISNFDQSPLIILEENLAVKQNLLPDCLKAFLVFAVPSPKNVEYYAVPVEFEILLRKIKENSYKSDQNLNLLNAIINYDRQFKIDMCTVMGTNSFQNEIFETSDLYTAIVNNIEKTLSELSPMERRTLEKIANNSGIVSKKELSHILKFPGDLSVDKILAKSPNNDENSLRNLFLKGILLGIRFSRYDHISIVAIPDELFLMTYSLSKNVHKINENIQIPKLQKAGDIALMIRKIFVGISFLSAFGKRRDAKTLSKYLSINIETIDFLLLTLKYDGLIEGSNTNFIITDKGLNIMKPNADNYLIFKNGINGSLSTIDNSYETSFLNDFHKKIESLADKRVNSLISPARIGDIALEIMKSSEALIAFRIVRFKILLLSQHYYYNSGVYSGKTISDITDKPLEFLQELVSRDLGLRLRQLYFLGELLISSEDFKDDDFISPIMKDYLSTSDSKLIGKESVKKEYSLSVLPDFEIIADISTDFNKLIKLSEFTEFISVDKMCVSKITKSSLLRYINKYGNVNQVLQLLNKMSKTGIPENVQHLIQEVTERQDEVKAISAQFVIKVKDRTILDNLLQLKEFKEYFGERISPEAIAISHEFSKERVLNAIRKKGYVVKIFD
ncbi:MAG: helicase-associated domain-containing protein [Thermoplasmataceae archaeon]